MTLGITGEELMNVHADIHARINEAEARQYADKAEIDAELKRRPLRGFAVPITVHQTKVSKPKDLEWFRSWAVALGEVRRMAWKHEMRLREHLNERNIGGPP
jgi:hypothetical protein